MYTDSARYHKAGNSAHLGIAVKVTKSKKNCPGSIFTLGTDFKTREWSTYHIDDLDASPLVNSDTGLSRLSVLKQTPKYQDIVIPTGVAVKESIEEKIPFSSMPVKYVVSPRNGIAPIDNKEEGQSQCISASQSVDSQSVNTECTNSIFGPRSPRESYSFRGTKLCPRSIRPTTKSSTVEADTHHRTDADNDVFSLYNHDSVMPHSSKDTLADLVHPSNSSSLLSEGAPQPSYPAHQIHSRMMGWKLTSPERRKDLLHLLETVNLSTASMTEEELRQHKQTVEDKGLRRIKHVAKRQAEAYEHTVSRLALHQSKAFKFNKTQLDKSKAKVTEFDDHKDANGGCKVVKPCGRKLGHTMSRRRHQSESEDPFARVELKKLFTAEAAEGARRRLAHRVETQKVSESAVNLEEPRKNTCLLPDQSPPSSPLHSNIYTPSFQTVGRNQRELLNPADRMELLSNARDVEKTVALSSLAAQMVDDYGADGNNFIGASSPKRGLTGEAYLLSVNPGRGGRKAVPMQTGFL